jgi:hypothetical protein
LSEIITSGRVLLGASGPAVPNKINRASRAPSARLRIPLTARSALAARTVVLLRRVCPALTVMAPSAKVIGREPLASATSMRSRTRVVSIGNP